MRREIHFSPWYKLLYWRKFRVILVCAMEPEDKFLYLHGAAALTIIGLAVAFSFYLALTIEDAHTAMKFGLIGVVLSAVGYALTCYLGARAEDDEKRPPRRRN